MNKVHPNEYPDLQTSFELEGKPRNLFPTLLGITAREKNEGRGITFSLIERISKDVSLFNSCSASFAREKREEGEEGG